MQQIRSVGVMSVAKMFAAIYGAIALIAVPFVLIAAAAGLMSGGSQAAFGAVGAVFIAILVPVVYAVVGFIGGAISALIYNLIAQKIGGIEVQLAPPAGAAAQSATA